MAITSAWKWFCKLETVYTLVPSTQTNFPVVIVWTGTAGTSTASFPSAMLVTGGANACKSDGSDIRFTSDLAGANEIPFEIVHITQNAAIANARLEIHFKVASISSVANTPVYMWWGNPAASAYAVGDTYGRNNVWTNGFISVWHMTESSGSAMVDSTGNQNAVYQAGLPARLDTGPMVSSQNFDHGANDWALMVSNSLWGFGTSKDGTITAVSKRIGSGLYQSYIVKEDSAAGGMAGSLRFQWYACDNNQYQSVRGQFSGGWNSGTGSVAISSSAYQHHAFVYNHTDMRAYINASVQTLFTETSDFPNDTYNSLTIGNWNTGGDLISCEIDELRGANVARSANWITTETNALTNPNGFVTSGGILSNSKVRGFGHYVHQLVGVHS